MKDQYNNIFNMLRGSVRPYQIKNIILPFITMHYMVEKSIVHGLSTKEKYGYYLPLEYKFINQPPRDSQAFMENLIKEVKRQIEIEIDFSEIKSLNEGFLSMLIHEIGLIEFGDKNAGEVFIRLINFISSWEGKEGGEYLTPNSLVDLLVALVDLKEIKNIYDPTMGLGMILQGIKKKYPNSLIYGQEINSQIYSYAIMNSILSDNLLDSHFSLGNTLSHPKNSNSIFDLIVSNCPFGLRIDSQELSSGGEHYEYLTKIGDIAFIQHAISRLSNNGKYIAIVPNGVLFRGGIEQEYRKSLINQGMIECVIGLPSGLFTNTGIACSVIIFDKSSKHSSVMFIDASDLFEINGRQKILSTDNINQIVSIYESKQLIPGTSSLVANDDVVHKDFTLSVPNYIDKFDYQFENIRANNPEYKHYVLGDLIDIIKGTEEIQDSLYLSKKGGINLKKIYSHDDIQSIGGEIEKDFICIMFKSNLLLPKYFEFFLESRMGEISLRELFYRSNGLISRFGYADNIEHFVSLRIILPSLLEQSKIIDAYSNLEKVIDSVDKIKKDLVINPSTANQATEQSFKILESLSKLTDADKIMDLIRRGEGINIEFKETLHYNQRAGKQKDEDLITASLKNIVAFLNTNGGDLLVGVYDYGEIIGIERDLKQYSSVDKFFLYIKDKLKKRIGEQFLQYISYEIIKVNNKDVLRFHCSNSQKECFLDEKSFYIRANPSAEELAGPKLQDYINTHFKK